MINNDNYAPAGIEITTDGSCRGNPGPGGWAAVITAIDASGAVIREETFSGGDEHTTNNRMEMQAVIEGLRRVKAAAHLPVVVRTDSAVVQGGMTEWLPGWQARGWRKTNGKPVENQDLWESIAAEMARLPLLTVVKVKGHSGDPRNEKADKAANAAAERAMVTGWAAE